MVLIKCRQQRRICNMARAIVTVLRTPRFIMPDEPQTIGRFVKPPIRTDL